MSKVWQQKDFINTCVRVDLEQNKKVLERLFQLGWYWHNESDKQNSFNFNYLYINQNKGLSAYNYFNENTQFKLIKFEDIVFLTEFKFGDKINYTGNNPELKGSGIVFDITDTEITIEYANGEQAKAPIEDFELLQEFDIIESNEIKCKRVDDIVNDNTGYKEKEGKLLTMELDAAFTKEMIKVLSYNKKSFGGKYDEGNHYKPMNPCELLSSAERHLLEVKESFQNNNIIDLIDDDKCSHIAKIAVNAMMCWIQLKKNNNGLE